jgi:3-oxoacyl-[acyl-carrier protein] reductase
MNVSEGMLDGPGQPIANRLQGLVAIVTGGAHGYGRAYVERLAAEGASVAVADINASLAESVAASQPNTISVPTDVTSTSSTRAMAERVAAQFGRIDVLVNNAGGAFVVRDFWEMDADADWDRIVDVNLKGPWLCVRAVFPYMREQGRGRIINIASDGFYRGQPPRVVPYLAAKGGVIGLTRALAWELKPFNIRVNAVSPGLVVFEKDDGSLSLDARLELQEGMIKERSVNRPGTPGDLAAVVSFLASADADFINGQSLSVNGGWTVT